MDFILCDGSHWVVVERAFVLKDRYHYLGIARPTDQELTAIEKTACYTHRSQEKGACQATGGATQESARVGEEAGAARGKCGQELCGGFCERSARGEAEEGGLGLASVTDFSGLCGPGAVQYQALE